MGLTLLMLVCLTSLSLLVLTHAAAHLKLSERPPSKSNEGPTPPISVLKPLKGVDESLYENLASFARQDYPGFELVLGVDNPRDPALEMALRLVQDFPDVKIRVVPQAVPFGMNPKVTNLASMLRAARYEHVLISDSNVRVDPGYLGAMARELADPTVGLVSSVIAGVGEQTRGALFENLHLNSFVVGSVASAHSVARIPAVVGKSMLFRRSDLAYLGGFAAVKDVLAEDYVLGRMFEAAGHRVVLSGHAIQTVNERWTVSRFVERHLRWAQMRRRVALWAFLGEPLLNPVFWLSLLAVASLGSSSPLHRFGPRAALGGVLGGVLFKVALDGLLMLRLQRRLSSPLGLLWVPVKDLLVAALWPVAALKSTVGWRGTRARITAGSVLVPLGKPAVAEIAVPVKEAA